MNYDRLLQTKKIRQLLASGSFDEASKLLERLIKTDPKNAELRILQCKSFLDMGRLEDALTLVRTQLIKATSNKQLYINLFFDVLRSAYERREYDFVFAAASWLAEFQDSIAMAWNFRGLAQLARNEFAGALESLQKAIERDRNNPHILVNLINAFISNGFPDEALPYAEQGLKLAPDMPVMINNVANAYKYAGELNLSVELYLKALTLDPNNAEVLANLGAAYTALDKKQLALDCFNRALQLRPELTTIKSNVAFILVEDGRLEEALAFCEEDLQVNPHSPHVWFSYGYLLMKANRLNAAIDAFVKAVSVSQNAMSTLLLPGIYSQLLFCMISHPDIPLSDIVALSKEFNEKFCLNQITDPIHYPNEKNPEKRIKLGFVGNSFVSHSCSRFVRPLIANLDREKVEVYIYATQGKEDEYTEWYKKQADHFRNCSGIGDRQMSMWIRKDEIDVICELDGHCYGNRLMMLAKKPAPVSFHWLDYGTSTGLTAIDYYLSDKYTAPYEIQPVISEKIWHLEGHSTVFEPAIGMGEPNELPYLTNGYITFGSLTRSIRINHRVVKVWSAVLNAVPNSRLVLNSGDLIDPKMREEMASRFTEMGVERERLLFGFDSPPWDVLRSFDIGLDCFPQNSGTTLMEMLYMGIPFVTLADRPPVGRIGTGILANLGCTDWIANTEEEYAQKLVILAHDIEGLQNIRRNLRGMMQNSVIMDVNFFARTFENAVRGMWQTYCQEAGK